MYPVFVVRKYLTSQLCNRNNVKLFLSVFFSECPAQRQGYCLQFHLHFKLWRVFLLLINVLYSMTGEMTALQPQGTGRQSHGATPQ